MIDFNQAQETARQKPDLKALLEALASGAKARDVLCEMCQLNEERYRAAKSELYDLGLITLGRRNGLVRLKSEEEFGKNRATAVLGPGLGMGPAPEPAMGFLEADLYPCLRDYLEVQEWFNYLYSGGATNISYSNQNPDLLGVALPTYSNLPSYDVDVAAIEVKRTVQEFLMDKLLAEVTTYRSFAHYVYAAYYKPWEALFQPAEEEEYERMLLLQGMGVGIFWVTCMRSGAEQRNYRCIMVQGATRGQPSADKMSEVLSHYQKHLQNREALSLPNLAHSAARYLMTTAFNV